MPEWLDGMESGNVPGDLVGVAVRIGLALCWGAIVASLFLLTHGRERRQAAAFATTLILLSGLIGMVSMVIGGNVARAFSLVGALSIVRFRTVVEDTRDTAFVIFAVIVGMASGAGLLWLPAIGLVLIGGVALAIQLQAWSGLEESIPLLIQVRISVAENPQDMIEPVLVRHFSRVRMLSAETAKQGVVMEYGYEAHASESNRIGLAAAELGQVAGVQGVEIRQTADRD